MGFNLADVLKDVPKLDTEQEQITYLSLDQLVSDDNNFYALHGIPELADNISVVGLQQPIRVREDKDSGAYRIVSGHRRTAALRVLFEEDPVKWQTAPCIIERDNASTALQQLRLIYANASTRQLSSAELSEQAQQVEQLLYQLQEEGYSFPGRMRDHVAEAVGASRSKLARLKVIRDHLIPEFAESWKGDHISESTAYTLAQASPERQRMIFEARGKKANGEFAWLTGSTVENCLREMDNARAICDKLTCFRGCTCDHAAAREKQAAKLESWNSLNCRGCCRDCPRLAECKKSCEYAGGIKKKQLAKAKAEKNEKKTAEEKRKAETDAREASAVDLAAEIFRRAEALRVERGVPSDDLAKIWAPYPSDYYTNSYEKYAAGEKPGPRTMLPGGIQPEDAKCLIATAEKLGCSVDYLIGRDVPVAETAPAPASVWRKGNPPESGHYALAYRFMWDKNGSTVEEAYWNGHGWIVSSMPILPEMVVVGWTEMPEDDREVR